METLLHASAALAGFAFHASIKASVLIMLVLLLQRLAKPYLSAHGRYFLWVAVVASLVTPIGFTMQLPQIDAWTGTPIDIGGVAGFVTAAAPQVSSHSLTSLTDMPEIAGHPSAGTGGMSFNDALAIAWLAGALLFLGTVLFRQLRFSSMVRAAMPADPALQSLLDECRRITGGGRAVHLLCSDSIDTPMVTGCFRPRLLLPAGTAELPERQLRHVFVHELMHVRHHDIACNWLLAVVQAAHWFNPLVWIGFRRLEVDREMARDSAAMHCLADGPEQYGRTLLELSQPGHRRQQTAGALGIVDDHTHLHSRIMMIARGRRPSRLQSVLAIMLLMLLTALAFSTPVIHSGSATPEVAAVPTMTMRPPIMPPARAIANTAEAGTPPVAAPPIKRITRASAAITALATQSAAQQGSGEGFVAAAAKSETMVAAQQTVPAPGATYPAPETHEDAVAAAPETYRDWNDIQTLAQAAEAAREGGVRSITEWNQASEQCRSSGRKSAECREVSRLVNSGQVSRFWSQCNRFIKTYNRLAVRFVRAQPAEFVDRYSVGNAMANSFRTLSEFCNTDVIQQKYPQVSALIRAAARAPAGVNPNPFWWQPQYVAGATTYYAPYYRVPGPANY